MSTSAITVGDGRYVLGDQVSARPGGGLWRARDQRLGRSVLIQRDERRWRGPSVQVLAVTTSAALVPVLDADDAGRTGDVYAVYPDSDLPTLVDALRARTAPIAPREASRVAAWLLAAREQLEAASGEIVALDSGSVLLDAAAAAEGACPVRWMPAPGAHHDDLDDVLRLLGRCVPRLRRRRWLAAVELMSDSHRRPTGRRTHFGARPVSTRTEKPCVSVEASS
ncbi:hypothetical protein ACXR2U_06735 [Jatrophihabitans sp. YIM 134969]